jgi:hypothetical protein
MCHGRNELQLALERQAEDRNYLVLTLDRERIIRMRACRNRDEARSFAGIT